MATIPPITIPVRFELDLDTNGLVLKPGEVLILRITDLPDHDYAAELVDAMRATLNERVGYGRWFVIALEVAPPAIDVAHLTRQRAFSLDTFGPGARTKAVVDHITKELVEVLDAPDDVSEWADVIILGFDGALRAGHDPADIIAAIKAKQTRNEGRAWPDWRTADPDKAIEHVRD